MNPVLNLIVVFTILIFGAMPVSADGQRGGMEVLQEEIKVLKELILDMKDKYARDNESLRKEILSIRHTYRNRIAELDDKIANLEHSETQREKSIVSLPAASRRRIYDNSFNPSISVILNGRYSNFSEKSSEIKGFGVGEEGERGREGLGLGESELNFSANIDDKFYGSLTAAIIREEGEDKVELEEAYVQTLPGTGLPTGLTLKAGRAFWTIGYLNEHHAHADDFADRPLVYRAFLNNSFNDDGVELSYILPTSVYTEIGGGVFRGEDFPGGSATGSAADSYSTFARIGGDIGDNQSWRIGTYWLGTDTGGRNTNEELLTFIGDNDLYVADLRYTWAPTGNAREQEVTLQGEIFWRDEDGIYEDSEAGTGQVPFDSNANGWYIQSVYKFHQQWRIGARYSRLETPDIPVGLINSALDANGHDHESYSLMMDWTNSEFSRIRLQYSREQLSNGGEDDQITLQYILSLGAHTAHKY